MSLTPTISLPAAATTPASVVQDIADDRIIITAQQQAAAATTIATSAATNAGAQTTIAGAQTSMAAAHATIAANMAKIANIDTVPYADYAVWMSFAVARSQQANATASSVPEIAVYADKALAEFKRRFPQPVATQAALLPPVANLSLDAKA